MARSPRAEGTKPGAPHAYALLLVFLLVSFAHAGDSAPGAPDAELEFSLRSQPLVRRSLDQLRQLAEPATVRVFEPYEAREASFAALRLDQLLDAVYGEAWRDEELLLLRCRDGYQPTVPVARVLSHRAWLAFARVDQSVFTISKRESGEQKQIELAPYYLVWENLDDAKIREEADYGWPYQLVSIDLVRLRDRFPKLAPAPGASAQVVAGFGAFLVHCSRCHMLNGEGGTIGPELVGVGSPLRHRAQSWLRDWIEDPSRIRPETRMEALNPALPDRARTVDQILAYLQTMLDQSSDAAGR